MFGNIFKYPPELLENKKIDYYIDVYGLATLFYDMIYNRQMFLLKDEYLKKNIIFDDYSDENKNFNKIIKFIYDNYKNINCDDILNFIKNLNIL